MQSAVVVGACVLGAVLCLWVILSALGATKQSKARDKAERQAIRDNYKDWKL